MGKKIKGGFVSLLPKKKSKLARLERRVRVTFFLVAETEEHIQAVLDVGIYLQTQYLLEGREKEIPVTGFTFSAIPEAASPPSGKSVFTGLWWHTEAGHKRLVTEKVVLFFIDFPVVAEEWKTDKDITLLKTRIFDFYEDHHSPQEEIWIVKQDIYRYA